MIYFDRHITICANKLLGKNASIGYEYKNIKILNMRVTSSLYRILETNGIVFG